MGEGEGEAREVVERRELRRGEIRRKQSEGTSGAQRVQADSSASTAAWVATGLSGEVQTCRCAEASAWGMAGRLRSFTKLLELCNDAATANTTHNVNSNANTR